jgi:2-hydroxy-6-oxonona-2,4-dienedioate hydrolase
VSGTEAARWASARWVEVRGERIRYREAGQGPALVLVHGLGVSADYWFRNGASLASRRIRVLAPDLPGFGRTRAANGAAEAPVLQAAALAAWADALRLEAAVYVGHSLSCQTVLELAARRPELVRGLVLSAPTGSGTTLQQATQFLELMMDVPLESIRLVTTVGLAYLQAGPLRVLRTWWRGTRHDPLARLPQVTVPGLVIVATRDPIVKRDFVQELAEGLPYGRVVWVEGGSHAVHHSRPAEFNRAVAEFVAEIEAGATGGG